VYALFIIATASRYVSFRLVGMSEQCEKLPFMKGICFQEEKAALRTLAFVSGDFSAARSPFVDGQIVFLLFEVILFCKYSGQTT
jgi:hypothetical protein